MPLSNIVILDLTRLYPGGYSSLMLADLGARVIKVEEPGTGDYFRHFPPLQQNEGAYFLALNINKESMVLDLKTQNGRTDFLSLMERSDVVLEGFRSGVMSRLGLGYEYLKRINPGLIYCALTGYGSDSPYRRKAGHDLNYLAQTGYLDVSRPKAGAPPIQPIQIADLAGGIFATLGILAALIKRSHTGTGSYIDISMADGVSSLMSLLFSRFWVTGEQSCATLEVGGATAYYNIYPTRDGRYITLAAMEQKFWKSFCTAIRREDLIPLQFTNEQKKLIEELRKIFLTKDLADWVQLLEPVDCCFAPVKSLREVEKDLHFQSRVCAQVQHPIEGLVKVVRTPLHQLHDSTEIRPAPLLGEHTWKIIEWLKQQSTID